MAKGINIKPNLPLYPLMTTIYHNPRCSKSRTTLGLLEERGIDPDVVLYLNDPLDAATLAELTRKLGVGIREIMRSGEARYKELNAGDPALSEEQLIAMVSENPILLERPIVVNGDRAAVGRPPENVLDIL